MGVTYRIAYHPSVVKEDLPKISSSAKKRIKTAIEAKLMSDPVLYGIPLRQSLKGHRKIRVGDFRIVFRIKSKSVFVTAIKHRSVVYKESEKRI